MTQLEKTQPASVIEAPRRTLDLRAVSQSRPWLPALVTAVILLVVGQVLSSGFASWNGLNQVLAAAAILAIASCGQTLVMISGDYGIDLSVGQVMSLTAIAGYMSMKGGSDYLAVGLLVAVLVGGLLGALSGVLVSLDSVACVGSHARHDGRRARHPDGSRVKRNSRRISAPTAQQADNVQRAGHQVGHAARGGIRRRDDAADCRTRFGRMLYFVGSNREAARLSGLPVRSIVLLTFVIAGVCSGFAGLLLLSYAGQANLDLGSGYLVLSIAATVIGGTSLAGGEGSISGAATGAIAFIVINTLMLTLGVSDALRQAVVGLLLLVLLGFNARTPRLRQ